MRRRYFKVGHRDKAEPAIINALVAAGDSVAKIGGKDLPDLAVGSKGVTYLLEIKSELSREGEKDGATRKPRKGKLKQGQEDFRLSWLGGPVVVAYTPEEALQKVGHTQAEIAQAREWSKGWTRRLTPEQRAALVRAALYPPRSGYTPPRGPGVDAARQAEVTFSPGDFAYRIVTTSRDDSRREIADLLDGCQACKIDPQDPCHHDGEEKAVALGLIPPRRTNQRPVDRLMAEQERLRAVQAAARR